MRPVFGSMYSRMFSPKLDSDFATAAVFEQLRDDRIFFRQRLKLPRPRRLSASGRRGSKRRPSPAAANRDLSRHGRTASPVRRRPKACPAARRPPSPARPSPFRAARASVPRPGRTRSAPSRRSARRSRIPDSPPVQGRRLSIFLRPARGAAPLSPRRGRRIRPGTSESSAALQSLTCCVLSSSCADEILSYICERMPAVLIACCDQLTREICVENPGDLGAQVTTRPFRIEFCVVRRSLSFRNRPAAALERSQVPCFP